MQVVITLENLAATPVCLDMDEQPVLMYARAFLERDLRPETLWSKSTATHASTPAITGASSSSSGVPPPTPVAGPSFTNDKEDEILRASDIEDYKEFFLGPPGPLMALVPAAKAYSKAMSLPDSASYNPFALFAKSVAVPSSVQHF